MNSYETALNVLVNNFNVNVDSFKSILDAASLETVDEFSVEECKNRILMLTGMDDVEIDEKDLKNVYRYLVRNLADSHRLSQTIEDVETYLQQSISETHELNEKIEREGLIGKAVRTTTDDKPKKVTKSAKARVIFAEMFGKEGVRPKDVQERFRDELDMSVLGARTYYYNLKKEFEELLEKEAEQQEEQQ